MCRIWRSIDGKNFDLWKPDVPLAKVYQNTHFKTQKGSDDRDCLSISANSAKSIAHLNSHMESKVRAKLITIDDTAKEDDRWSKMSDDSKNDVLCFSQVDDLLIKDSVD